MSARGDLRVLWATRKTSGFPWPFQRGMLGPSWGYVYMLMTGHSPWSAVPFWRQMLGIPLRPWRYARMVREIARVRNFPYGPSANDDVP